MLEEGRTKPSSNFGNVLDLESLLQQPEYLSPGNPDASKIYSTMQNGEMPYDVASFERFDGPSAEEIATIRSWIEGANATLVAECQTRDRMTPGDVVNLLASDLDDQADHRVKTTRYITLTHLYNACVDDETMTVYRQGVVKLLNSLSRRSTDTPAHSERQFSAWRSISSRRRSSCRIKSSQVSLGGGLRAVMPMFKSPQLHSKLPIASSP